MDESAANISFDQDGVCNFCTDFARNAPAPRDDTRRGEDFSRIVKDIATSGRGKRYDCVVGVSGGVDSSYVLHKVVEAGLRPLAVHLDNGWNSEMAVSNIAALVTELHVDLFTHVIDWDENRDMQLSMFRAGVVDIELLMDNAMLALNAQIARRFGLRFIISGNNRVTEGVAMPVGWNHYKMDARNIRAIHKRFGSVPIRTHPLISTVDYVLDKYLRRIAWVSLLDHVAYEKTAALDLLVRQYGYKPYPYKHYESVFTRYYQGHILPAKFGIDKRRVHFSTLIMSGQMTRNDALLDLSKPPYDATQLARDQLFVLKKLGVDQQWLSDYIQSPAHDHLEYDSELPRLRLALRMFAKAKVIVRRAA